MGEKDEQTMSRLELADYLTNLGQQLRQGAFSAQGRHWTVPDDLFVRMEFKEKKGHLGAKLSWSWSTLGDYDRAAREEVSRGQDSMKTVKKRLGAAFKALQQAVSQGGFPEARTLEDFVASFPGLCRHGRAGLGDCHAGISRPPGEPGARRGQPPAGSHAPRTPRPAKLHGHLPPGIQVRRQEPRLTEAITYIISPALFCRGGF